MSPMAGGGDAFAAAWREIRTSNGRPITITHDNAVAMALAEGLGVLSKLQELTPPCGSGVITSKLVEDVVTGFFALIIRYAGFASQDANGWEAVISRDVVGLDDYWAEVQRRASLGTSPR